jgi:Tol biopolymer transport system component
MTSHRHHTVPARLILMMAACCTAAMLLAPTAAGATIPGPNGKIAFTRYDPNADAPRMFTIDPNGDHEAEIPVAPAGCPGWSPDSTRLLMCTPNAAGYDRPATVDPDGSGFTLLDAYPGLPLHLSCSLWSPGGDRLLCTGGDDADPASIGIYTVRSSDGGDLTQVSTQPEDRADVPVGYSPDGSSILYLRQDPNGDINGDLYVVDPDGTNPRRLNPAWLRATSSDFEGRFDLFECCGPNAAWSPDGSFVVFTGRWSVSHHGFKGYQVAVFVVNADGTGLRRISPLGIGARDGLAVSPDGGLVAFSTRAKIQYPQVWVVRPDGTGLRELTVPTQGDVSVGPVWSPDSTKILFRSFHPELNGGQEDLWVINPDGTGLRRVTSPKPGLVGEDAPNWGSAPTS